MSLCLVLSCRHSNQKQSQICDQCGAPLLISDRYRVLKEIGSGGFGRTYLGVDERSPDKAAYAIKQFCPSLINDTERAANLFRREADQLRSLSFQNIPRFVDFIEWQGQQFILQEYIDGETLADEAAKLGPFSEAKIRDVLQQILPVLDYIHHQNLIHRDIKPANIIRRHRDGQLFLVDFGATKMITGTALAKTGTRIGSAEYTAPEQLRGKATFASDLYSLGTTCLSLFTGISPFELVDAENQWVWRDWSHDRPISKSLGQILDGLIKPGLSQRFVSARQVLRCLANPQSQRQYPTPWHVGGTLMSLLAVGYIIYGFIDFERTRLSLESPLDLPPIPSNPPTPSVDIEPPRTEQDTKEPSEEETSPPKSIARTTDEDLGLMEIFFSHVNLQGQYFQRHGKFLPDPSQPPIPHDSHFFKVDAIENGVQISGIPRGQKDYGYAAVLWGGENSAANQKRKQEWRPADPTDMGTLALPNLSSSSLYEVRVVYCESLQPTDAEAPLATAPASLPLSTHELPCPAGYAFSHGLIQSIAQLAAKEPPPAVLIKRAPSGKTTPPILK